MGAIDDMRGNMLVDEGRNKSNDNHAGHEESDQSAGRGAGRESSSSEVFLRGGEHAIEGGEELQGLVLQV